MSKIQSAEFLFAFNELNRRADSIDEIIKLFQSNSSMISKQEFQTLYKRVFELYAKSEEICKNMKKLID